MKAEKLYLGNIITMDEVKPRAEALTVVGDKIQYVGSEKTARSLCDENTEVFDFKGQTIYPGFIDSHTHPAVAGSRAIGQADLNGLPIGDLKSYGPIIKEFIEKHPEMDVYMAAGWNEGEDGEPTHEFLDEIYSEKPLLMNTSGGHSLLLNKKAMEKWGITADYAKEAGYDLVHVDDNGNPTGYVCEGVAVKIAQEIMASTPLDTTKNLIMFWQTYAASNGLTGSVDAGSEGFVLNDNDAIKILDDEGKLKFNFYSYVLVPDNPDNPKGEIERIKKIKDEKETKHLKIIGPKAFLDGVMEARTSWMNCAYADDPEYYGNQRFNDHDKMVELITYASKNNMSVHVHSEGSGATTFMLGCIEDSQKETGDMDQRNALAHLHFVEDEDLQRLADTNSVAIVPPTWVPKIPGAIELEVSRIGQEWSDKSYPIKSFFDAGAVTVFHSDYPIGGSVDIPLSIYTAVTRAYPPTEDILSALPGATAETLKMTTRGDDQAITREQAIRAQTIDVARMVHAENKVGSLEIGKLANLSIFDNDFLTCPLEEIMDTQVVATVIDGEIVYRKK